MSDSTPIERIADLAVAHHKCCADLHNARARVEALENAVRAAWLGCRAEEWDSVQTILHVALEDK
jgi:hypothetical protein